MALNSPASVTSTLSGSDPDLSHADVSALCEAFPGVRHVELSGADKLPFLFDSTPPPTLGSAGRPIDLWTELESLTLHGLPLKWLERDQFSAWVVGRQALGLRRLHVKLMNLPPFNLRNINCDFTLLYGVLKENCTLELDRFPIILGMIYLYMSMNSPLRMVGTSILCT